MTAPSESYPAFYLILTLLNALRRGIPQRQIWREFQRQKVTLQPRLSFWIALCKEAGLLDAFDGRLRVTGFARRWLNKDIEEQTFDLIDAWQNAPKDRKTRQFRKKLLWKLKYDKSLTAKDKKFLSQLQALGLVKEDRLTVWGRYFLKGEGDLPTPKAPETCHLDGDQFLVPLPQHIDLLWELERFLRPASPGRYPLNRRALQYANGDPQAWVDLLELGLGGPLPGGIRAQLLGQPSLRILRGVTLEFSHPEDLSALRRQSNFRTHIHRVISPRHVMVDERQAVSLMKMLVRRGICLETHEETSPEEQPKRTHFTKPSLLQPLGPSVPKLQVLRKYLQLQQGLDMLYHAPGYAPEPRRITPLSIEERNGQTYVIAWCQSRRGQRTFRLDRMEIPGTY
ncbi:MAG: WYL domain-containing protein [Chloroflexi bacterium]|nr:WYL domain-containing protein [Chloroflexota bacterium]